MDYLNLDGLSHFLSKLKSLFATKDNLSNHVNNVSNPHQVTVEQIGALTVDLADTDYGNVNLINADLFDGMNIDQFAMLTDIDSVNANINSNIEQVNNNINDVSVELSAVETEIKSNYLLKNETAVNSTEFADYTLDEHTRYIFNLMYPTGSCYTTSTNESPASYLGGEWELVDKQFASQFISGDSVFTANTTYSTLSNAYACLSGHTIRIRLQIKSVSALGDTAVNFGTLNLDAIGVTDLKQSYFTIGMSDGGNGISMVSISQDTGLVQHTDCITKASNGTITASQNLNISFTVNVTQGVMLDSFCDKFVWKRTA